MYIISTCLLIFLNFSIVINAKYRICVVDGKGGYKRSLQYCPSLDTPDSKVECVVGVDRLDCLRRISKNTADFSVFNPEDLIIARNSEIEILVTNQLQYTKDKHEYEVVAVVTKESGITSRHDLKEKRYCHPGYGYETDFNRILANYLEASVVPQLCNPRLTITENRIKATSEFFKSSCKAGPWVNNYLDDEKLKRKYPNLCNLCDNPSTCSMNDKYWGRRGPLLCLTDGAGDISWARLDDVRIHFGLTPGGMESTPDDYMLLCPDDKLIPLNTTNPCVWTVKPWPVVAARRTIAQEIQEITSTIKYNDQSEWKANLYNLIQMAHSAIVKIDPIEPIETYLDKATGFLSANSFSGCHPPRTVHICTTSIIENAKCSWLRESAAVYGIEPDLECIKADNITHCMLALKLQAADVALVPPNLVNFAKREYHLKTLFYETTNDLNKYITAAVTKTNTNLKTLNDLKGKKACFPVYDGIAWNSVKNSLYKKHLIGNCASDDAMAEFFGPSCVPNIKNKKLYEMCENSNIEDSEMEAIRCLTSGRGDVAFISKNSLQKFVNNERDSFRNRYKLQDFRVICADIKENCHFSWAPLNYGMVRGNSTDFWLNDTLNIFLQLDHLFGKSSKELTNPFTLYGIYDGKSNILFHDSTIRLRNVPYEKDINKMPLFYDDLMTDRLQCQLSKGHQHISSIFVTFLTILIKLLLL